MSSNKIVLGFKAITEPNKILTKEILDGRQIEQYSYINKREASFN